MLVVKSKLIDVKCQSPLVSRKRKTFNLGVTPIGSRDFYKSLIVNRSARL